MTDVKIAALMACYNRKEKTAQAIKSIAENNPDICFSFFIVDDRSTDGTRDMLLKLQKDYDIQILPGTGTLFYSKSMNVAMNRVKRQVDKNFQYILLMNDDVSFYPGTIEEIVRQSRESHHAVIAGATVNHKGEQSYGAVRYLEHSIRYKMLSPSEHQIQADTFNGNCVLVPWEIFICNPSMDPYYTHGMGDFDYGMMLRARQVAIYGSKEYIGLCENNPVTGTWQDPSLSFLSRLRKKESRKGLPVRDWFHYLRKYFGLHTALLRSITPYIKIIMRR